MSNAFAFQAIRSGFGILTFVCMLMLAGVEVAVAADAAPASRPEIWATAVAASPGLPNLHRVNANLYRSAQPLKEGFVVLAAKKPLVSDDMPIKTIISLRAFNDDASVTPEASALHLEQIRFKTWHPEDEDVVKFLRIATTPTMQPVLVHCQHGADRTGTMVAIYRIAYQGWSKAQAKEEMVKGGFGYHPIWKNLLRYIDRLDVEAIKRQVAKQGAWQG